MRYEDLTEAQTAGVAPWTNEATELSDHHVTVYKDAYPVTDGHLLFVPKFNNNVVIEDALKYAFRYGHAMVANQRWEAFNIGMNCGEPAGQTVMYPHIHLIPRKTGDCEDPVGGVRGVIPGQANYKSNGYQLPT